MSRVAPSSGAVSQSRRIKANWTFEGTGQSAVRFSNSQRSQSTTDTQPSDASIDATPWWHETATLPTQPLSSEGSPSMQATIGHDSPPDQSHLSSSDEDQSQLPSGLQKTWRRPSVGLEESGVTWQGERSNGMEQCRTHESMGRRSFGNDMTPLQYTIDCSPEVSTSTEDCTNDGVDSGLGSATTMFANQEIVDYMNQHLMHYMNPLALLPNLQQQHLLTEEDVDYIKSPYRSDEERKERILSAMLLQEGDSIDRLVDCLSQETSHSGHKYLARRLREAVEKKQQYPDKPLRLGSPPPSDSIKPRGAVHRNSIARLLATKRNNVANMISRIEAKESFHRTHQQEKPQVKSLPQPNQPAYLSPKHEQRERESSKMKVEMQHNALRSTCTSTHSQVASPESPSPTASLPHSPQQTSDQSRTHNGRRSSSEDRNTPGSPPHLSTSTQSSTPPHSLTPPHSQSPSSGTPFLSHTPPFSSQEDTPNSSPRSLSTTPKRRRPVNEMVIRRRQSGTSTPPNSPQLPNKDMQAGPVEEVSKNQSDLVSEAHVRRKSLPEVLSSPPTSPKVPMLPPTSPPPAYIHPPKYTEEVHVSEKQLSPTSSLSPADNTAENVQGGSGKSNVAYRPRTSRLLGLTTRFHKHRRSASMSSCENRPSSRADPLTDSLGVMMERSPFHHRRGKAEPGHQVRASLREGNEKLIKRRIEWLQERVHFNDCPEHVQFNSKTHYGEQRELLYSGTLHKHGKARFVVLFTDMLLVLKARRPTIPSRVFHFQSTRIDWFSDLEYTARKPLPLHLLTVQQKSSKQGNDSFCLHFNDQNKVLEVVLQAVSKEARDIWVEDLSEAIKFATSAHAESYVLIGNKALRKNSGEPYKKLQLTIHRASNLGLAANCNSFSLFCVIEVGKQRCRTPSAMGGYNPSWDYQCEFTEFSDTDGLLIDVYSENIFRPNDFLGCVNIPLQSLPEEHSGRRHFEGSMVLAGLEEAYAGEIELVVEQGWETKM